MQCNNLGTFAPVPPPHESSALPVPVSVPRGEAQAAPANPGRGGPSAHPPASALGGTRPGADIASSVLRAPRGTAARAAARAAPNAVPRQPLDRAELLTEPSQGDHTDAVDAFMARIAAKNPGQPEFLQAVREVVETLLPHLETLPPEYRDQKILERLCEPDRVVQFRVEWTDDRNQVQVNRGYRVQMNNAVGPYKGGLRFHPSVDLSVLKFLAFEQTLKNSLTGLPLGGAKGGADFDPKGKSDAEVMRFCNSLMTELHRHVGPDLDVPAGDIGVGAREVGYLYGQYKRLTRLSDGALTGKAPAYGGSLIRPEATGYGLLYFTEQMLAKRGATLAGTTVVISGSGNVAQHACEKAIALGAKVVAMSDSSGCIYDPDGIDAKKLAFIQELKNVRRGRIREYAEHYGCEYTPKGKPWSIKADVALPCATQNELDGADARALIANGCFCVAEGANMPCTPEAISAFSDAGVLYAPGKASNAGGVAVSGLEMSQNAQHMAWSRQQVDETLKKVMVEVHEACVSSGQQPDGTIDYVAGANIAGFRKVADAMLAQGHM